MKRRAFTLVEVVLAILIISGIMTVLLYFYHRAAQVRQAALEQVRTWMLQAAPQVQAPASRRGSGGE